MNTYVHLPILQVVIPLVAAPVCSLIPRARAAWAFATGISWIAFVISIKLARRVLSEGTLHYEIGGWAAPWGIEYVLDATNILVMLVITGIGAVVVTFARESVAKEVTSNRLHLFYAMYLLCLTGLLGITITGDAFNVFVFLEISSLSSYALIGMGPNRRALTAAFRYLIMGTIGATFILIGIGLMYMMTGTLNMADLAERLPAVYDSRTIHVAFAFLTVGIGLKLAVFPLHMWLPNAYTYAPSAVSAFLAGTATKVALYVLLRFFFTIFGASFSFVTMQLNLVLLPLSLIAIVMASLGAIVQTNAKRLLAYSSIAQIGYMTLGISLVTLAGLGAGILHLFNHALMKGCVFLALGCVVYRTGSANIRDMSGIGRSMPWTMGAFVIGGLSLIGVPFTAGFVSKWYLLQAMLEKNATDLVVAVVVGSLLAIAYVWRVVETAYFGEASEETKHVREAPLSLLLPTWMLALANIYFGMDTTFTVRVAHLAAAGLLGDIQP